MSNAGKTNRTSKVDLKKTEVQYVPEEKNERILLDELITLMSLLDYPLTLSTEKKGQGKTVRFDKFGQTKKVMYGTLVDMMENNRNFLEWGYYIILDSRVIRDHGLQEVYDGILNKDKINEILSGSKDSIVLYNSCNAGQRDVIIEMMIDKLKVDPESIDLNIIDKISRISGIEIAERADNARVRLEQMKPA